MERKRWAFELGGWILIILAGGLEGMGSEGGFVTANSTGRKVFMVIGLLALVLYVW